MSDGVYYRVLGGEASRFLRDWRERTKAIEDIYRDFATAKGGVGYTRYVGMRFGGVIFEGEPPLGWKKHKQPCSDGARFSLPIKRGEGAAEGKVFQEEIDALPPLPSEDEFIERFGIPRSLSYNGGDVRQGAERLTAGSWKNAQIAWINEGDSFWVVLPDIDARIASHIEKGRKVSPDSWVVPDGLERVTRAHYELAIAQEKVAKLESAA